MAQASYRSVCIRNLSGVYTGSGFVKKAGRRPLFEDCGWIRGPLDILIENGRIKAIAKQISTASQSISNEIDGSGMWAGPGFVDSHTHAVFDGTRAHEYFSRWNGKSYVEISAEGGGILSTFTSVFASSDQELENCVNRFVNLVRSQGTLTCEIKTGYGNTPEQELRLLRILKKCRQQHPEIVSTFLGLHAIPPGYSEAQWTDAMIDLLPIVQSEQLAAHVDTFADRGFFSLAQATRFCQAAQVHGLKIKAHADEISNVGASDAFMSLNALSIDHLQNISDHALNRISQSLTVATLLPATSFYLNIPYTNARALIDAGARVALASDYNPGTAPQASLLFSALLASKEMKLQPWEIWAGLTYNGAAALGLEHERGHLEVGARALINLFNNDYSHQPNGALTQIEQVIVEQRAPAKVLSLLASQ